MRTLNWQYCCAALPYYVTGGSIGFEKSRIDFDLGEETFEFESLNQIINDFIPRFILPIRSICYKELYQ